MAEATELTVSYSRRVQLDRYEPIEHSAEINVSLEEGEDADAVYDSYSDDVEGMVERAIAARVTRRKLESEDDE